MARQSSLQSRLLLPIPWRDESNTPERGAIFRLQVDHSFVRCYRAPIYSDDDDQKDILADVVLFIALLDFRRRHFLREGQRQRVSVVGRRLARGAWDHLAITYGATQSRQAEAAR